MQQGVTFEKPSWVLLLQGEKFSGSRSDLGQAILDAPYLSLVPETVLADKLELLVEPGLLERPPGCRVVLAVFGRDPPVQRITILTRGQVTSLVEVNQAIL